MLEASVIICAHNPRVSSLRRVLDALRHQNVALDNWELLLIDNSSTEPLKSYWDISWHPNARHVYETELGLAHARQRGIHEVASDLLIFVDDDNVLNHNYISEALRISAGWPELGVWSTGCIRPEYAVEPPARLQTLLHYLCIRETKTACWSNVFPCADATPYGAGLCVRRN